MDTYKYRIEYIETNDDRIIPEISTLDELNKCFTFEDPITGHVVQSGCTNETRRRSGGTNTLPDADLMYNMFYNDHTKNDFIETYYIYLFIFEDGRVIRQMKETHINTCK